MTFWPAYRIRALFRPVTEIYQDANEGRQFDAVYFVMLVLACLIALLGLLLNSPAVIIGAMLISPLMGPILACGLSLTVADWQVGKKAARNVALSVAEAILITVVATRLSPLRELTPEILARTNPNLMDLLIAFFSGLAGTLALSSRKTAMTILPGVAIATAVLPPLVTVGYGIGTLQWSVARGALMLFFTNFAAIVLSAGLVFLLIGVRPRAFTERQNFISRHRISIAVLILVGLSIPLLETLRSAAQQAQLRKEASELLMRRLAKSQDRQLDSVKLQIAKDHVGVAAIVQTSRFIEPQEVQSLQSELTKVMGRPVQLELQQLQLAKQEKAAPVASKDYLGGGVVTQTDATANRPSPAAAVSKAQETVQTSLDSLLAPVGVSELNVRSVGLQSDGNLLLEVSAAQVQTVGQAAWQVAAESVSRDLGIPLQIRADVALVDRTYELQYKAKATRLTARQIADLRKFGRSPKVPGNQYVLRYSPDESPDLAKRRIDFLSRYLNAARMNTQPDPKLAADSIVIRETTHFVASGGQVQDH